ncbi:MAG: dihydropteroate synthase [Pseudomonadota bacterium]
MTQYFRPLIQHGPCPIEGVPLCDGPLWFQKCEVLERVDTQARFCAAREVDPGVLARLTAKRAAISGLSWDQPRLMGILNVTPDSFSDGGLFEAPEAALAQAQAMAEAGADILDIGGESTRPGASYVEIEDEIARTAPVIEALAQPGQVPISIDTRKADVARAALEAGAAWINDVSALQFDPKMGALAVQSSVPVCLMHAQGAPETMQNDPQYADVLLDVYDALEGYVAQAEALGIDRAQIIVDPGIGFGKTLEHNLALLRGLSLFHGLGALVLLGASRKRFIGTIGQADVAAKRMPGSVAVALAGAAQGVQLFRVHDIAETKQALRLWEALHLAG